MTYGLFADIVTATHFYAKILSALCESLHFARASICIPSFKAIILHLVGIKGEVTNS